MPRLLLAAALVVAITPGLARSQTCPYNQINGVNSSLSVDEKIVSGSGCCGSGGWSARYNVPAGTLSASVHGSGDFGASTSSLVVDDFTVVGLPNGTPVALTVHFAGGLNGGGYADAYTVVTATVGIVGGDFVDRRVPNEDPGNFDLSLSVAAIAGQPTRLRFKIDAYCHASSGGGGGSFTFAGLPPGAGIVSCQGYVAGVVVPASGTTWGRLKTLYR